MTIEAWHFLRANHRLGNNDNRLVVPGGILTVDPPIARCKYGLHGSVKAIDALCYAPGPHISRVVLSGYVIEGDDKAVATVRYCDWIADAEATLREFSRWCALQVIHLWDAPPVVREYLETGDEKLRAEARAAAARAEARAAAAWAEVRAAAASAAARAAAWAAEASAAVSARKNQKLEEMLWQLKN